MAEPINIAVSRCTKSFWHVNGGVETIAPSCHPALNKWHVIARIVISITAAINRRKTGAIINKDKIICNVGITAIVLPNRLRWLDK